MAAYLPTPAHLVQNEPRAYLPTPTHPLAGWVLLHATALALAQSVACTELRVVHRRSPPDVATHAVPGAAHSGGRGLRGSILRLDLSRNLPLATELRATGCLLRWRVVLHHCDARPWASGRRRWNPPRRRRRRRRSRRAPCSPWRWKVSLGRFEAQRVLAPPSYLPTPHTPCPKRAPTYLPTPPNACTK